MKIVIDARFLGFQGYGVGKYVDNLLSNLLEIDSENEYLILLHRKNFHLFNPRVDNFKKVLVDAHWYGPKEQLEVPLAILRQKPDLVHFPHFNVPLLWAGRFVVTIHDLTLEKYGNEISKNKFFPIKRLLYRLTMKKAVKASKRIITPSQVVKKELIGNFSITDEKIVVTPEAVEEYFISHSENPFSDGGKKKLFSTYGIKEPYILTVGNSFPYKNIKTVIKSLLRIPNITLVHVSKRDRFSEELIEFSKNLKVEKRFFLTGYVPKGDLLSLYRYSKAFVFPSFSEGFGLPGLEAMAVGTLVVVSDIKVFREVYGEAPLYFKPDSPDDLAEKLNRFLKDKVGRESYVEKGYSQVKKYSWKKLAKRTLEVYNSV